MESGQILTRKTDDLTQGGPERFHGHGSEELRPLWKFPLGTGRRAVRNEEIVPGGNFKSVKPRSVEA